MGTKRFLAAPVADAIEQISGKGHVVDLFCGTGAVTEGLSEVAPVIMNDVSEFLGPLLRFRFASSERTRPSSIVETIRPRYNQRRTALEEEFHELLLAERIGLAKGQAALCDYIDHAPHVGNNDEFRKLAQLARRRKGPRRYCLATIYFSAGYFSVQQAIQIDALRYAIDGISDDSTWDQAMAAFMVTIDRSLNAPGHSAQYLRPNTVSAYKRIRSVYSRDAWDIYIDAISGLRPLGKQRWRQQNIFSNQSATSFLSNNEKNLRAVYADPPYTKDQYSRYYHVHESLFRYDFPDSKGKGRYRTDRFSSDFSSGRRVVDAFDSLFSSTASQSRPLVLSYPMDGLLAGQGIAVDEMARQYFASVQTRNFGATHSTMGASKGTSKHDKVESIHVCIP